MTPRVIARSEVGGDIADVFSAILTFMVALFLLWEFVSWAFYLLGMVEAMT